MRGVFAWLLILAGCREGGVKAVEPELGVDPPVIDFGIVKVGQTRVLTVSLSSRTQAAVEVSGLTVRGAGFLATPSSRSIPSLGRAALEVTFAPGAAGDATGSLELSSNDVRAPLQTVELRGRGAFSEVRLELGCDADAGCLATISRAPGSIDFGDEPLLRRLPLEPAQLPFLDVRNTGPVPAVVDTTLSGNDAGGFTLLGPERVTVEPDAGLRVPVRFVPPTQASTPFSATLEVRTDAPAAPFTPFVLTGRARPNLPPTVCLNLTEVQLGAGPKATWTGESDWQAPRDGGYDFTSTRPIAPGAVVTFSAHSPAARGCTADPEDGRLLLTYEWTLESTPGPPPALAGATSPVLRLVPVATGDTVVKLVVRDAQGNASEARATFRVDVRNDLVVQLAWSAPDGGGAGVDLDVLLVRPNGRPYGLVLGADGGGVSDSASGFVTQNAVRALGVTPEWGAPGPGDDPRLNVDDSGDGPLVENISLNAPGNACGSGPCRFGIFVHVFRDGRPLSARTCQVNDPCRDGEACDCPAPGRCVADAAPLDAGVAGAGRCQQPVDVEVQVFSASQRVGTLPLALSPPDRLSLVSPCHLLHVADVDWPVSGSDAGVRLLPVGVDGQGRFTMPALSRFGWRPASVTPARDCAPNTRRAVGASNTPWFSEEPR